MKPIVSLIAVTALMGAAAAQDERITTPRVWDDRALGDWATLIAALGVRPGHLTSKEYYAVPGENLRSYPVYRPDREPQGYWEWLQKQKPEPLIDVRKLQSRADWIKAGEITFQTMTDSMFATSDPDRIRAYRDMKSHEGVWTKEDGTLLADRWVVTEHGVELRATACAVCHARVAADGQVLWGAPRGRAPSGYRDVVPVRALFIPTPDWMWRQFTVPWDRDERVEKIREFTDNQALLRFLRSSATPETFARAHGSPYYMTKIPDLNNLRYSRYIDATGTHRLRGPEDIARYAAFITGADPMQFGPYQILSPEQRRIKTRYADEVLYAIGVYLMSLDPPQNRDFAPADVIAAGRRVFARENCAVCHVPPDYTSGKLTLAQGYTPPAHHPNDGDIVRTSVGTDPGLALRTRKGTGFYKIPSLRGVWYRPALLHDGSVGSLEEMFDPGRLKPDHEPGGWKGPGVTNRAIPGHPFGLALQSSDRAALLAFLRSL